MNDAFLVPLILAASGFGAWFIYLYLKQKRTRLLSTGIPAEGIVVDFVSRMNNDSYNKYPVIRFVTRKHEWITVTYNISYPGFVLKKGQRVTVFYNPEKPSDFVLDLKIDTWLLRILAGIAILCFAWALYSLINVYKIK